jgi:hypothetical protein
MSLDLPQLLQPVDDLSAYAARRAQDAAAAIPAALQSLHAAAQADPETLNRKIAAAGPGWRGARPTDEPLDAVYPLPAHPPRLHVIGADGSQVYADRHAVAFFYLINVGGIHLLHGSGETPYAYTRPAIYFREEDLQTSSGGSIDDSIINTRRDVAEMGVLAELSTRARGEPGLALLDNGLMLWQASQEHRAVAPEVRELMGDYLKAMSSVKTAGVSLVGVIDRPRHTHLLALLALAEMPDEMVGAETARRAPLHGLTDRRLMLAVLGENERSARFVPVAPLNQTFADRGHEVQAFYLKTAGDITRVEVPAWVGEDAEALDRVHAGIVEQCRVTGIPYVLVRAHELAVVRQPDRQALDQLVAAALNRHGVVAGISRKALTKRWTASRRRHVIR